MELMRRMSTIDFAEDVLYMHVNSPVICKMESEVFCCSIE